MSIVSIILLYPQSTHFFDQEVIPQTSTDANQRVGCISGFLNMDHYTFAQSAAVRTHLDTQSSLNYVCSVQIC
jgi:hypothetical protein